MKKNINTIAINIIIKAGEALTKKYKTFNRSNIKLKHRREIVTKADLLSEKIIINQIKKSFPDHQILSEEAGRLNNNSDYLWIIDPMDGTTNFSMHNPLWSISIALAYKEKIILGLIYAPLINELFLARPGQGAKLFSPAKSKTGKKIKVSEINKGKILNSFCSGRSLRDTKRAIKYYAKQKTTGFDCRQLGSAAIDLAYVASGRIESIVIPGANAWDVAAGALLVKEANGRVTDFKGKDWDLNSKDIVASNRKVHPGLLRVLKNI